MSNPFLNQKALLLAAISTLGVYHAQAGTVEVTDPAEKAAVVQHLVAQGVIIPLAQENWYQISRERLEAAFDQSQGGSTEAINVINLLKAIVGPEVNVREVELINIELGTQDYSIDK